MAANLTPAVIAKLGIEQLTHLATMNKPSLGRSDATPSLQIDTFPIDGTLQRVDFYSDELTAVCPVTQQPDFYNINITYQPKNRCIETKSLKLYLRTFDQTGIFAEHLAPEIAKHLANAVQSTVTVTLEQKVRGGITTKVTAVSD